MDPVNAASTFLLIRLGTIMPKQRMKYFLMVLFEANETYSLMPALIRKLSKSNKLNERYKYWLKSDRISPLNKTELYLIFNHAHVFNFSANVFSELSKVEDALCELIPFLILHYHHKNASPSQNEYH